MKHYYESNSPGNHVRLELRRDACLHITRNKEKLASVDVEVIFDMLQGFLHDTNCTRPGIRRRKALLEFATEGKHSHEAHQQEEP